MDRFTWGITVYVIGIFRSRMEVNEMGFYFAVLILGLFATVSVQEVLRNRYENIPVSGVYFSLALLALVSALTMFIIALIRVELLPSEVGFYGISYFLTLFGAICVQKMVRDREDLGSKIILVEPEINRTTSSLFEKAETED